MGTRSIEVLARDVAAVVELTEASLTYDATVPLKSFAGARFAIHTPANDAPLSLHHVIPGIPHVVIEGTGHWIQLDKPDEFNRALDNMLRGL